MSENKMPETAETKAAVEPKATRGERATRDLETREAESKAYSFMPASLLPDPVQRPGWVYRWIKIANGSLSDQRHVSLRFREGWRPVTPSEQPEIAASMPKGGAGEERIVIGELMLCTMPAEKRTARREYYQTQNARQVEGVTAQLMSQSDARMPILAPEISTQTSKRI